MKRFVLACGGIIALMIGALPAAAAASTSTDVQYTSMALRAPSFREVSSNWAGYDVDVHGKKYKSVSASWVQPGLRSGRPVVGGPVPTGTATAETSYWVGLDGDGSSTVEQLGTDYSHFGKHIVSDAWVEMVPGPSLYILGSNGKLAPVHPGDHISASISYLGGNKFAMYLRDATRHWYFSDVLSAGYPGRVRANLASAEVISEAPINSSTGSVVPLVPFRRITFTNAHGLGSHPDQTIQENQAGKILQSVSPIGRGRFTVTYRASA